MANKDHALADGVVRVPLIGVSCDPGPQIEIETGWIRSVGVALPQRKLDGEWQLPAVCAEMIHDHIGAAVRAMSSAPPQQYIVIGIDDRGAPVALHLM